MIKFSVIIPIYNESSNLEQLILEISKALSGYNNYEIIFVNDGSNDNSKSIINNIKIKYPVKLIDHPTNKGQSFSILSGIKNSSYNTIVTIDGDGQNNPMDIPKLLNKFYDSKNISLLSGIRVNRKDNFIKILSSKIANSIRSFVLQDDCPDTGCSLKVFKKDIFLKFPFFDGIHRFLPALFRGFGYKIYFMSVDHRPRRAGKSNYGIFNRLFKGIYDLIRVKKIISRYK